MVISPYSEYVNHYEAVSEIFKEAMTSKPAFLEELKVGIWAPHDKTNKMAYAPSKESDQPGYLPSLIRVFAVRMKKVWVLSYPRLWSDWADTQADLSFRWAHSHFVGFVMRRLISVVFWATADANGPVGLMLIKFQSVNLLSHIMRKPVFRGLRPGKTETGLLSNRN